MEKVEKKIYTAEEIKAIAPNYRGKPENFDPNRKKGMGKKVEQNPKSSVPPKIKSIEVPKPTHLQEKATPQRNESIISEAIFGVDVSVTEIAPRQSFASNYSKIVDVAKKVYDEIRVDDRQIDRIMVKEELSYYSTALLHLKLLEIKAEQGEEALTSAEKDIRKATQDIEFNVPQPLFMYLSEIGAYCDKMGKETRLEIPPLPTTRVQGFGGYHAAEITTDTYNLFEEVPSLGIAGDMLMAVASQGVEPQPNFRVGRPPGSLFTDNLVGSS